MVKTNLWRRPVVAIILALVLLVGAYAIIEMVRSVPMEDYLDKQLVDDFMELHDSLSEEATPEELKLLQHFKPYFQSIADREVPSASKRVCETIRFGDDWVVYYEVLYQLPTDHHAQVELQCDMALSFAIINTLNGHFMGEELNGMPDLGELTQKSNGRIGFADKNSPVSQYYTDMVHNGDTPWDY